MRREHGFAAHFIGAARCLFHRTTEIGSVVVSTVGDYRPSGDKVEDRTSIGHNRFYETMVFRIDGRCACGCELPEHNGQEIDFEGYLTAEAANAGHEAMCVKHEALATKTANAPQLAAEV